MDLLADFYFGENCSLPSEYSAKFHVVKPNALSS